MKLSRRHAERGLRSAERRTNNFINNVELMLADVTTIGEVPGLSTQSSGPMEGRIEGPALLTSLKRELERQRRSLCRWWPLVRQLREDASVTTAASARAAAEEYPELTPLQSHCFDLFHDAGLNSRRIATRLGLRRREVRQAITQAYTKLSLRDDAAEEQE